MLSVQGGDGRSNLMPDTIPFDDLELGPLLGKGSFGRVYRGHWEERPVAVKVCWPTTPESGPSPSLAVSTNPELSSPRPKPIRRQP